jgi:chromosome segregation ATPase
MSPVKNEYSFNEKFGTLQELKRTLEEGAIENPSHFLEALKSIETSWINDRLRELLIAGGYVASIQEVKPQLLNQDMLTQIQEFISTWAEKIEFTNIREETESFLKTQPVEHFLSDLDRWIKLINQVIGHQAQFEKYIEPLNQLAAQNAESLLSTHTDVNLDAISKQWQSTAKRLAQFSPDHYPMTTLIPVSSTTPVTPKRTRHGTKTLSDTSEVELEGQGERSPDSPHTPRAPHRTKLWLSPGRAYQHAPEELYTKYHTVLNELRDTQTKFSEVERDLYLLQQKLNETNKNLKKSEEELDDYRKKETIYTDQEKEVASLKSKLGKLEKQKRQSDHNLFVFTGESEQKIYELETQGKTQENHIKTLEENLKGYKERYDELQADYISLDKERDQILQSIKQFVGYSENDTTDQIKLEMLVKQLEKQKHAEENKRAELEKKYQTADEKIKELRTRLQEVSREYEQKIAQVKEIEWQNTKELLEAEGYDDKILKLIEEKKVLEDRIATLTEQLETTQKNYDRFENESSQLKQAYETQQEKIDSLTVEIESKTQALLQAQEDKEHDLHIASSQEDKDKIEALELEIEQLHHQYDASQEVIDELTDALHTYTEELKGIEQTLANNEQEKAEAQLQYDLIVDELQNTQKELDQLKSQLAFAQQEQKPTLPRSKHLDPHWVYDQSKKLKTLVTHFLVEIERTKLGMEKTHTQALKQQASTYQAAMTSIETQLSIQTDKLTALENKYEDAQTENLTLESELAFTKERLTKLEAEKENACHTIKQLETKIEHLRQEMDDHNLNHSLDEEAFLESQQKIESLQTELEATKEKLHHLEDHHQNTQTTYQHQSDDYQSKIHTLQDLKKQLKLSQTQFFKLWIILQHKTKTHQSQIQHWIKSQADLKSKLTGAESKLTGAESKLTGAQDIIDDYRKQLHALTESHKTLQAHLNQYIESNPEWMPEGYEESIQGMSASHPAYTMPEDEKAEWIAQLQNTQKEREAFQRAFTKAKDKIRDLYNERKEQKKVIQELEQRLEEGNLTRANTTESVFSHPVIKRIDTDITTPDSTAYRPAQERPTDNKEVTAGLEIQVDQLKTEIDKLKIQITDLERELGAKNRQLEGHNHTIEQQNEEITHLQTHIANIGEQFYEQLDQQVEETTQCLQDKVNSLKTMLEEKQEELDQLRVKKAPPTAQLVSTSTQTSPSSSIQAADQELDKLKTQLEALRQEMKSPEPKAPKGLIPSTSVNHLTTQVDKLTDQMNQFSQLFQSQLTQKHTEPDSIWSKLEPILQDLKFQVTRLNDVMQQHTTQATTSVIQALQARIQQLEFNSTQSAIRSQVSTHSAPPITQATFNSTHPIRPTLYVDKHTGPTAGRPFTPPDDQELPALYPQASTMAAGLNKPFLSATLNHGPLPLPSKASQSIPHLTSDKVIATTPAQENPFDALQHMAKWLQTHTPQLTYALAQYGYQLLDTQFNTLIEQHTPCENAAVMEACRLLIQDNLKDYLMVEAHLPPVPIVALHQDQIKAYTAYDLFKPNQPLQEPLVLTPHCALHREDIESTSDLKLQLCPTHAPQPHDIHTALLKFTQMIIAHAEIYPNLTLTVDDTPYAHEFITYLEAYQALYTSVLDKTLHLNIQTQVSCPKPSTQEILQKQAIILGTQECALFKNTLPTPDSISNPNTLSSATKSPAFSPLLAGT